MATEWATGGKQLRRLTCSSTDTEALNFRTPGVSSWAPDCDDMLIRLELLMLFTANCALIFSLRALFGRMYNVSLIYIATGKLVSNGKWKRGHKKKVECVDE